AARERFQREARAASSLNHPNICVVYDVGEAAGHPFLVMELLEGETLRERIASRSLDVATALALAVQVADALDAATAKESSIATSSRETFSLLYVAMPRCLISALQSRIKLWKQKGLR